MVIADNLHIQSVEKYAFVSDYCRFVALYEYGGIYFDTDVKVIKPMDNIIANGNFMGFEVDPDGVNTPGKYAPRYCFAVNPGVGFALRAKHPFVKKMLKYYEELVFSAPPSDIAWYKTVVAYTTELLCENGLENKKGIQQIGDITIYPHEFFAPIDVITGRLKITENTYSIHRYMGSWGVKATPFTSAWIKNKIRSFIPLWVFYANNKLKRRRYKVCSGR